LCFWKTTSGLLQTLPKSSNWWTCVYGTLSHQAIRGWKSWIYYKIVLKLANCLQHKVNDSFFTTFLKMWLLPYLSVAIARMKHDMLLQHKKVAITCEESIRDAWNYWNLLQPP
jgi:hypothetical protein